MQTTRPPAAQLPSSAISALMEGEIVHAIRVVRQSESIGFSEAKRLIERYIMCDPVLRQYWVKRRYAARNVISRFVWCLFVVVVLVLMCFAIYH